MKLYKPKKKYLELQEWLSKPFNQQRFSDYTKEIDSLLDSGVTYNSVIGSASNLGLRSSWWKNIFLTDVWDNNASRLSSGALMLDCIYWKIRILTTKYDYLLGFN